MRKIGCGNSQMPDWFFSCSKRDVQGHNIHAMSCGHFCHVPHLTPWSTCTGRTGIMHFFRRPFNSEVSGESWFLVPWVVWSCVKLTIKKKRTSVFPRKVTLIELFISLCLMSYLRTVNFLFHRKKNQAAHFREWVYQAEPLWVGGLKVPPARVFPRVVLVISYLFLRKMYHFIFIIFHTCISIYTFTIIRHVYYTTCASSTVLVPYLPKRVQNAGYHVGNRGLATRIMYVDMYKYICNYIYIHLITCLYRLYRFTGCINFVLPRSFWTRHQIYGFLPGSFSRVFFLAWQRGEGRGIADCHVGSPTDHVLSQKTDVLIRRNSWKRYLNTRMFWCLGLHLGWWFWQFGLMDHRELVTLQKRMRRFNKLLKKISLDSHLCLAENVLESLCSLVKNSMNPWLLRPASEKFTSGTSGYR